MADADPQTVLRMALAMCCADKDSLLDRYERAHYVTRLQVVDQTGTHMPFTAAETQMILPRLLAWAEARRASFGVLLRELLTGEEPHTYLRPGTQLALVDPHHRGDADQSPVTIPLHRRTSSHASTRRKG